MYGLSRFSEEKFSNRFKVCIMLNDAKLNYYKLRNHVFISFDEIYLEKFESKVVYRKNSKN
jgi:hypothetical protein